MKNLTEQLAQCYEEVWNQFESEKEKAGLQIQNPFLLSVTRYKDGKADEDWYTKADLKVCFFGKEAYRLDGAQGESPRGIMAGVYEDFYATYYREEKDGLVTYFSEDGMKSPFFRVGCNGIMSEITERMKKSHPGKRAAYLWNNISKFSTPEGGAVDASTHQVERDYFHVIPREMQILQPDVLIFFTGPGENDYYRYIRENFEMEGGPEPLANLPVHEVTKLNLKEVKLAYKTYHPRASLSDERRWAHYHAIIDDIMNHIDEILK